MIRVSTYPAPPVCQKEILRYAGCREADHQTQELLERCLQEALPKLTYRVCWREMDKAYFDSENLKKNLSGCERIIIFAATIGVEIDRLIAKYGHLQPSGALMLQALGAERIEALCDSFCADLEAQTGLSARPRFSPGYGDLKLETQKDIFALLEPMKHIGLSLTDSLLMSPSKSVTAFVGLGNEPKKNTNKCSLCPKKNCTFRSAL